MSMIFYLEDNKKWSQLMDLMKTCSDGGGRVSFLWNSIEGWMLMQNSECLENMDTDHLVLLSHFRMRFFSSFMNTSHLDRATFEMDVSKIQSSLRSVRKTTKKVIFSLTFNPNEINLNQKTTDLQKDGQSEGINQNGIALFSMQVFAEEGVLEISREVYLNGKLNQSLYFSHQRQVNMESVACLEVPQCYLRCVKEFRNCIIQLHLSEKYIDVESLNGHQDLLLQISTTLCKNYDFQLLQKTFDHRNRLIIPPNFLISLVHLAKKYNQTVQLRLSPDIIAGRATLYTRLQSDSFEILSAFTTIFDYDDDDQDEDIDRQYHQIQKPHENSHVKHKSIQMNSNMLQQLSLSSSLNPSNSGQVSIRSKQNNQNDQQYPLIVNCNQYELKNKKIIDDAQNKRIQIEPINKQIEVQPSLKPPTGKFGQTIEKESSVKNGLSRMMQEDISSIEKKEDGNTNGWISMSMSGMDYRKHIKDLRESTNKSTKSNDNRRTVPHEEELNQKDILDEEEEDNQNRVTNQNKRKRIRSHLRNDSPTHLKKVAQHPSKHHNQQNNNSNNQSKHEKGIFSTHLDTERDNSHDKLIKRLFSSKEGVESMLTIIDKSPSPILNQNKLAPYTLIPSKPIKSELFSQDHLKRKQNNTQFNNPGNLFHLSKLFQTQQHIMR